MFARDLLEKHPNDVAVLSTFTDHHFMFKPTGPFSVRDNYYIGNDCYSFDTPLTAEMIKKGIEYFEKCSGCNSMENHSIRNNIINLRALLGLITR